MAVASGAGVAPVAIPPLGAGAIPVTRAAPQAAPGERQRGGKSASSVERKESDPETLLCSSAFLRQWCRLPEESEDGTSRFSPQHSKPLFALVCFGSRGVPVEFHVLRASQVILGREEGFVQILNDPAVSARHSQLAYRDDMALVLTDLNSTNGTFFRIRPSQGYRLWDGCNLIIGKQVLT